MVLGFCVGVILVGLPRRSEIGVNFAHLVFYTLVSFT